MAATKVSRCLDGRRSGGEHPAAVAASAPFFAFIRSALAPAPGAPGMAFAHQPCADVVAIEAKPAQRATVVVAAHGLNLHLTTQQPCGQRGRGLAPARLAPLGCVQADQPDRHRTLAGRSNPYGVAVGHAADGAIEGRGHARAGEAARQQDDSEQDLKPRHGRHSRADPMTVQCSPQPALGSGPQAARWG